MGHETLSKVMLFNYSKKSTGLIRVEMDRLGKFKPGTQNNYTGVIEKITGERITVLVYRVLEYEKERV